MTASYHSHRDLKLFRIGQILQEVYKRFFFLANLKEGGALRVDRCMSVDFSNSERETRYSSNA